jgi:formamidopyrimidine-DNA glycosylase
MPELPEVEVVRRGIDQWSTKRTISRVEVLHQRAVRRQTDDLAGELVGQEFRCASRRGKYLWLPFVKEPSCLIVHLGMSGQLLVQPEHAQHEKHLRVLINFADGGNDLRFVDQRTFGLVQTDTMVSDGAGGAIPAQVAHIARDPLDPLFDDDFWRTQLRRKDTEIKRTLLDQALISGIGNIYADESLWRAKIHGQKRASSLTGPQAREVLSQARAVMTEALAAGGTSFDSLYVNVNGDSGYFSRSLNAYGQEGEPCPRCGSIIQREKFMNRSSFSCPRCQRMQGRSGR